MIYDPVLDAKPRPSVKEEVMIAPVPQDFLADEFIMNGPLIARAAATSEGRYEPVDLLQACWDNEMLCWLVVKMAGDRRGQTLGVIFTDIAEYPRMRTFRLRYAAGVSLGEWVGLLYTTVQEAAKQEGCSMVETICRPGWSRILRKHGIKPKALVLELKL